MQPVRRSIAILGGIIGIGILVCRGTTADANRRTTGDKDLLSAVCPIVYPLDQSPAERGYHYIFYGNAFFIDREGDLLTAAHVLTDLRNGGEPHILLRLPEAPPRLVKVEVVSLDSQHDIALLHATPNPFQGKYEVASLALSSAKPARGSSVLVAALRPVRLKDPHTFDAPREDLYPADVLRYTATRLDRGQPEAEVFLFDHEVLRGQSGAPIVSRETHEVVGIVEGQWLRGIPGSPATSPGNRPTTLGAGLPIDSALGLLEQKGMWQNRPGSSR